MRLVGERRVLIVVAVMVLASACSSGSSDADLHEAVERDSAVAPTADDDESGDGVSLDRKGGDLDPDGVDRDRAAADGVHDAADDPDADGGPRREAGQPDGSGPDPSAPRPAPLQEGGMFEEALDGHDPFAEEGFEFDCVAEDDLETLHDQLGPDAVAEFEELIEAGYLERC